MPAAADPPLYPYEKITREFRDELLELYQTRGREAALAKFRAAVAGEPWFEQPGSHCPLDGVSRVDWEFGCLMTGEGEMD